MSLSRLNYRLPRAHAHPQIMQGTADCHHQIADALLPQADPIFDNASLSIARASEVREQEMRVPPRRITIKRRVSNTALIELCKLRRGEMR
jgi:hypothetical protein